MFISRQLPFQSSLLLRTAEIIQSAFDKPYIHVVKEIIDILHRHQEIFEAKFKREDSRVIQLVFVNFISADGHWFR